MSDVKAKLEEAAAIFRHLSSSEVSVERQRKFRWAAAELDEIIALVANRALRRNRKGPASPLED
jgi:7,8-dihydro-6-hydroxymethylpterin-pyrophosphokinase